MIRSWDGCKYALLTRGALALATVWTLTACRSEPAARACQPGPPDSLMAALRPALVGQSEYTVIGALGRPPRLSVSGRSEKSYLYPLCADSSRVLTVRFSGSGQAKEVYLAAATDTSTTATRATAY